MRCRLQSGSLEQREVVAPAAIDEKRCSEIIERYTQAYITELLPLTDIVNRVAAHIPGRANANSISACSAIPGGPAVSRCPGRSLLLLPCIRLAFLQRFSGCLRLTGYDLAFVREVYVNFDRTFSMQPGT